MRGGVRRCDDLRMVEYDCRLSGYAGCERLRSRMRHVRTAERLADDAYVAVYRERAAFGFRGSHNRPGHSVRRQVCMRKWQRRGSDHMDHRHNQQPATGRPGA
jgi:hypothetical protein